MTDPTATAARDRRLWTPPGATTLPRVVLPEGDVQLANGLLLRDGGPHRTEGVEGRYWRGPHRLSVIASIDDTPRWGKLMHVSLAYPNRDPHWSEIRAVRDAFFGPNIDTMMVLPRAQDYVNLHGHCFHVWQTPEAWGLQ